jgi:hypothetical protein
MPDNVPPYKLDRKRFIMFYEHRVKKIIAKSAIKDLILGSEYVITAQDVLDSMETIDGCLVNQPGRVLSTDCILTYG